MRPIPSLFLRDPADRRFVGPQVNPDAGWVVAGEGVATRPYDGVCVLYDPALDPGYLAGFPELQHWWRRVKVRRGGLYDFHRAVATDPDGDRVVAWEPADLSPALVRPLSRAVLALSTAPVVGTHELIGPGINRNPERAREPRLIAHAGAEPVEAPRDYEGLRGWLPAQPFPGVVWHHLQPNGTVLMAKARRRDFRA